MVKLGSDIKVGLLVGDEEVSFTFREPTNAELNKFLNGRYSMRRGKSIDDKSAESRADFFDLLLIKVENLEDNDGSPIAPENKDKIPSNWKTTIILEAFETQSVSLKN
ncbi:MAG: hypothetical protein KKH94_11355 [Candidatus Omnitrophica bacterium]|nr:hypothetical protein [Candidatus Omnitrophota bacterium]